MAQTTDLMEKVVSLCKRRGFIFQGSEIYGGLANTWDYGPFGVELKRNIKDAWWKTNIRERMDMAGLDAAILMHPKVWEASGHLKSFADPFVKCVACGNFFRFDRIWDEILNSPWCISLKEGMKGEKSASYYQHWARTEGKKLVQNLSLVKDPEITLSFLGDTVEKFGETGVDFKTFVTRIACTRDGIAKTPCPSCGNPLPEESMAANLMLETFFGPIRDTAQKVYLRPETAQGIFVNFLNIVDVSRKKLPFGIAQIGKSFRNEITPGNITFRTREFEQMEIEYFVRPEESQKHYEYWVQERYNWYLSLGIKKENLRLRPHNMGELAHYAKACSDIEYQFPFGWSELEGIANRGDFDLVQHSKFSGKELSYFDTNTKEKIVPYIIEPSGGVDRAALAFLVDAYSEEKVYPVRNHSQNVSNENVSNGVKEETRVILKFSKELAPMKIAVLPLLKNRPEIVELAKKIYQDLRGSFACVYDDTAAIGKLYRRQDEVGTLFCLTVDVQSLEDKQVTVRDRDTMKQERISVDKLKEYFREKLA